MQLKKINWNLVGIIFLVITSLSFFWRYFLQNLIPIPADIIVGIYFPWRDQIWNGFGAGVPFKNGHLSDIVSIIYPWRIYGISLMKEGIAPLWIPQALGGTPLLANFQSGLAYPLNFLFWIFKDADAWSIYIILQPILASIFFFLFLRNLKITIIASLFGSIIFAFSGFTLVWLEYGIVGHAGLWLPLALLAVNQLKEKNRIKWIILGAISVGFSLLSGYPQISLFTIAIIFFYIFFRYRQDKNKNYFAGFIFLIWGILLAAVQVFPGLELMKLSIRSTDPTAAAFNYGILPIRNLILLIVPDFFGNPATGNYWDKVGYNESAVFIGIIGIIFSAFSVLSKKHKDTIFFVAIFFISILFVFDNPLAYFPRQLNIPGLSAASAGRFLFLTTFSLSVLSGFGVDAYLNMEKKKGAILILMMFLGIFAMVGFYVFENQKVDVNLIVAKRNLILPSLILTISAVFLLTGLVFKKLRLLLTFCLLGLLIFDLFRFGWKYNSFSKKEFLFPETLLTDILKEKIGIDRFYGVIPQSMFIPYNFSSPEGYEPLMTKNYSEFANLINQEKFNKIETGSRWVIVNRHESPLLNLLGVKYMLSFNGAPVGDWDPQYFKYPKEKYSLIYQYGFTQIYENKDAIPRIFIAHDYLIKGKESTLDSLNNSEFNYQTTLLLEETPEFEPEKKVGDDQVNVDEVKYWKNEIAIESKSESDGFLFLSDNYYPGWKALIDGKETKIYKTDYTFRSIFVRKGEHKIRFVYDPIIFKIGLLCSTFSFAIAVFLLAFSMKGNKFNDK